MLSIDLESFSFCDLKKHGAYRYSTHPTTEVLICSYKMGSDPVKRWHPGMAYPFKGYDGPIYAWNSQFERLMWSGVLAKHHGWPEMDLERFICTAATSRANAMPGSLDNAGRCMNIISKKDQTGHRLMMKICTPDADGNRYHPTNDELDDLYAYCDQDVRAEAELARHLRPLSPRELGVFWDAERVNDRGIKIDTAFARAAVEYASEEKKHFGKILSAATGGAVTTAHQHQRIKDWVLPKLSDAAAKITQVKGKTSMDKNVRAELLNAAAAKPGFVPDDVVDLVEAIDKVSKSSISKYQAMLDRTCLDGRLRGTYLAFGAGQTGRYSSTGAQLHNFIRIVAKRAIYLINCFKAGDTARVRELGEIIPLLSSLLRATLIPEEGRSMVWGDWSAIEARVNPWLSGHPAGLAKLGLFEQGVDIYRENVRNMGLGDPMDDDDRQKGKVVELSLGFGGGLGALKAMARGYGVHVDDDEGQRWVWAWRDTNPWARSFWNALESACLGAIDRPGTIHTAGKLSYCYDGGVFKGMGALWCKLPSGRLLTYPNAKIEKVETPWGDEKWGVTAIKGNWTPKQGEKEWPRMTLWYGLACENGVQATAADLQMEAISALLNAGLDIVAHTHDEDVIETDFPETDAQVVNEIMARQPAWADVPIPLDVDVKHGARYKVPTPKEAA